MASRGATPEFSGVTLVARMSCAFASPCTHTAASIKSEGSTSILSRHPMPVPGRRAHADFLACRPMRASIMRACVHARASSSFWLFAFPLACRDAGGGGAGDAGRLIGFFSTCAEDARLKGRIKIASLPPPPLRRGGASFRSGNYLGNRGQIDIARRRDACHRIPTISPNRWKPIPSLAILILLLVEYKERAMVNRHQTCSGNALPDENRPVLHGDR